MDSSPSLLPILHHEPAKSPDSSPSRTDRSAAATIIAQTILSQQRSSADSLPATPDASITATSIQSISAELRSSDSPSITTVATFPSTTIFPSTPRNETQTLASDAPGYTSSDVVGSTAEVHLYAKPSIPIDLHDLILYFFERKKLVDSYEGQQEQRNKVAISKRELGQIALVCRSWAHLCQQKIFGAVILDSVTAFRELLSLVSHPCSQIAQYIVRLELKADVKSTPWVHTVCTQIRPRSIWPSHQPGSPFPFYEGHYLTLVGSKAEGVLKSGPHAALPKRPLPAVFSRSITSIAIARTELTGLEEVVQLCRKFPSLGDLRLQRVTWRTVPTVDVETFSPLVSHRLEKKRFLVRAVHIFDCEAPWVGLPLACFLNGSRPLCAEDVTVLANLAQVLTASVEKAGHPKPMTWTSYKQWGYEFAVRSTYDRLLAPRLCFTRAQDRASGKWHVDVLMLKFVRFADGKICHLSRMVEYDWERFDEHAMTFPTLKHIILSFSSHNAFARFVQEIEPKLVRLRVSPLFKYALFDCDPSKVPSKAWITCASSKSVEECRKGKRVAENELHKLYA